MTLSNLEKIKNMNICVGIESCKNCPLRGARVGEDWEHKDCTHINLITWLESEVSENDNG